MFPSFGGLMWAYGNQDMFNEYIAQLFTRFMNEYERFVFIVAPIVMSFACLAGVLVHYFWTKKRFFRKFRPLPQNLLSIILTTLIILIATYLAMYIYYRVHFSWEYMNITTWARLNGYRSPFYDLFVDVVVWLFFGCVGIMLIIKGLFMKNKT